MINPKHSKSCQILGRILVISCFLYFVCLFFSNTVFAQDCSCDYIEGEASDRYIKIDGETYFYLELDKSRKLQKDIKKLDLIQNENSLLEDKLELKDIIIESQKETISVLNQELKYQRDFSRQYIEQKRKEDKRQNMFWNTPEFGFGVGLAVGAIGSYFIVSAIK